MQCINRISKVLNMLESLNEIKTITPKFELVRMGDGKTSYQQNFYK